MNKKRLLKLAKHLESGKLGHAHFDFTTFHEGKPTKLHCGTSGCALGECPVVFRKDWEFEGREVSLRGKHLGAYLSAEIFFGLQQREVYELFNPFTQWSRLHASATAKEVAANIRAFIERKEKKE